jgi:hypothetical protein
MQSHTAKPDDNALVKLEITTLGELDALYTKLFQDEGNTTAAPLISHLSFVLDQLPLGRDSEGGSSVSRLPDLCIDSNKQGRRIDTALKRIISRLSELPSFTTLSISCPCSNPLRLNWRSLDSSAPGQDITSKLSLYDWSHSGRARLPTLHISGFSQVPAQAMYAWMNRASSISLEYVTLDFSTFGNFQIPSIDGQVQPSSTLQHCSLKLRPLEFANFIHFHRNVLGQQSPLLRSKSLELWAGGPLKNSEMVAQFLQKGSPVPQSLEQFAIYRWFDKDVDGEGESCRLQLANRI